jgi:hypothetical protein
VKLVHLVGFIIKKFVTTHGHMNLKFIKESLEGLTVGQGPSLIKGT